MARTPYTLEHWSEHAQSLSNLTFRGSEMLTGFMPLYVTQVPK